MSKISDEIFEDRINDVIDLVRTRPKRRAEFYAHRDGLANYLVDNHDVSFVDAVDHIEDFLETIRKTCHTEKCARQPHGRIDYVDPEYPDDDVLVKEWRCRQCLIAIEDFQGIHGLDYTFRGRGDLKE